MEEIFNAAAALLNSGDSGDVDTAKLAAAVSRAAGYLRGAANLDDDAALPPACAGYAAPLAVMYYNNADTAVSGGVTSFREGDFSVTSTETAYEALLRGINAAAARYRRILW